MSLPTDTDAVSAFKAAMQSLLGGVFGWMLTCSLAGVIATAAATDNLNDLDWFWALAWIGHLAVAAVGVWGLLVICLHAFCASALIHGTDHVLRTIVMAFVLQLVTSSIVMMFFESEHWVRLIVVCGSLSLIGVGFLIGSFRQERKCLLACSGIEPTPTDQRYSHMFEPRPGRYGAVDRLPAAPTRKAGLRGGKLSARSVVHKQNPFPYGR
jgi:hypothetical protein